MAYLVIVYGAPLSGAASVAWALARSLAAKTAVVSTGHLVEGAIAVPDRDALAELEMAHTQLRLLVATYLKSRYNVVVEGPFFHERDGALHDFEAQIDQLVSLMRNLAQRSLVVRIDAPEEALAARAEAAGRMSELATSKRVRAAYRPRDGARFLSFDSAALSAEEIARRLRSALGEETLS